MKSTVLTITALLITITLLHSQIKLIPDNRWDDQFTSGNSPDNYVNAIAYDNGEIYIGGEFINAGGNACNYLTVWDGSSWQNLGGGVNGKINTIFLLNNNIYIGGNFNLAGTTSVSNIAYWDGSQWNDLGGGTNGEIFTIEEKDGYIYAGGIFSTAGSTPANNIAYWDGTNWSSLNTGVNDTVFVIKSDGTNLYVGGKFTSADGVSNTAYIAGWNNSNWFSLGTGTDNTVYDIIANSGSLYAAGNFLNAGGSVVNHFAKWDGSNWYNLGNGINGNVYSMTQNGSNIYLGGVFTDANGTSVSNICMFDGNNYSALGSGVDNKVSELCFSDYELLVGGKFVNAGGKTSLYFARWISPPVIISHPSFVDACEGDTVTFTIQAGGTPPFSYQWLLNGSIIPGATDSFYTIYGTMPSDSGNYQCMVMNAADTVTSNIAVLDFHYPPVITVEPVNYADCEGNSALFSITATSTLPMTYQWQHYSNNINGANAYLYTIPSLTEADTGLYHCIVSNQCGSDTSQDAKLMVYPTPTVYFTGLDLNYCTNSEPDTLTPHPSGGAFSGPGMTNNIFNPQGLLGIFTIQYSYTDSNGCSDTYTKDTEVHGIPSVSFSGLNYDYCVNDNQSVLTGTPSGGTFNGNGIYINNFYPDSAGVGTFDISYVYTDNNGCTNSDTQSVTVHELPDIFIGNDTSVCEGQSFYIYMTGDFGNYGWDFTTVNNTSVEVFPVADTSYSGWIMSSYGCLSRDTIFITVNQNPSIISITGLDSVYCNTAQPDTLIALPSGGIFNNPGFIGNIFYPDAVNPGSQQIIYMYTDTNGCSASDTLSTVIKPVMNISFSGLNAQYCANDPADTLIGNPQGGTFSGGNISGNIFSPTLAGPGTHNIIYQIPDTNGCMAYDTNTVIVFALPSINTSPDTALCQGDTASLYALSDTVQFLMWSTLENNDTIAVAPSQNTVYYVTVSNGYCYNTDSVYIQIYPLPGVDLGTDRDMCRHEELNAGSGYALYSWIPDLSNDSILQVDQTGTYYVTVTTTEGCSASDNVNINVLSTPEVDLGNDLSITTDQVTLIGIGGNYDSYLWSTGDTTSLITIIGDSLGVGQHMLWAQATNTNGCSDIDTIIITVNYGLLCNNFSQNQIYIYPNPASDYIFIENDNAKPVSYRLCDINGQILFKRIFNNNKEIINIKNFNPGVYILQLNLDNKIIKEKIIIN
ncbi:MAG: hypothetical protein Kow0068_22050 [Marinilabiliales bacterium]